MDFGATKKGVFNRGVPPDSFLAELATWGKSAPDEIFAPNDHYDIYDKVKPELGPYETLTKRCASLPGSNRHGIGRRALTRREPALIRTKTPNPGRGRFPTIHGAFRRNF